MEQKPNNGSVVILLFVLAFAVIVVDEVPVRVAIAFVPALLLAQRAMGAGSGPRENEEAHAPDRRGDFVVRKGVDELLAQIREFYLTVHLMSSGKISEEQVLERTGEVEGNLNRLLANMSDAVSPGES